MDSTSLLAVALGGAIGAVIRAHLLGLGGTPTGDPERASTQRYPILATLLANTLGCLLLGDWLAGAPADPDSTRWLGDFVAVGLCGGLTTFSTFCSDAVHLSRTEGRAAGVAYIAASFGLGTGGLWLGLGLPPLV